MELPVNPLSLLGILFHEVFFRPIVNLLIVILHGLEFVHIPGALGLSVIILTVLIRAVTWPFMSAQLKSSRKMMELKPKLDELKNKHGKDKQALAVAQAALYKEHNINPAAGCLPTIIQFPVLIALYQAILTVFNSSGGLSKVNELLYSSALNITKAPDLSFLGMNLAARPSDFAHAGAYLLLVPVITAGLQFIQATMMTPLKPVKEYPSDSPREKKEKEGAEDTMGAVQSQMRIMMPLMIGYFAFTFPIALAVYWNTMTIIGIVQQYVVSGWGGMTGTVQKLKIKK
ncbi:MAG: YidC/Oxa1 family membrane protein insertase [Candidatus Paceibacterales bacterium]